MNESGAAAALAPRDNGRVLVADDETPIRELFKMILGHGLPTAQVDLACNGLEAVRAFQLNHHGVITMDLRMPEMGGLEAARAILEFCREKNWEPPSVVFCTGFVPPSGMDEILGDGSLHCLLHKPVTSDKIITTVKSRLPK